MRFSNLSLMIAAILGLMIAGCGPQGIKKVTFNGKVTYKGKPLTSGLLQFAGDNNFFTTAVIQSDGTFIVTDVIPGEVKVGYIDSPSGSGSSSGDTKGEVKAPAPSISLPSKFRDPNMSGLKITVKDDTKDITINIE